MYRKWYNAKHSDQHFAIGKEVVLKATNLRTKQLCKKLDAKYLRPFLIIDRLGKLSYKLKLPLSMSRIHPVFYVSLLERWRKP